MKKGGHALIAKRNAEAHASSVFSVVDRVMERST